MASCGPCHKVGAPEYWDRSFSHVVQCMWHSTVFAFINTYSMLLGDGVLDQRDHQARLDQAGNGNGTIQKDLVRPSTALFLQFIF